MPKSKHRKDFKKKQSNRRNRIVDEKRSADKLMKANIKKVEEYLADQNIAEAKENVEIENKMQQPSSPFSNDLVQHSLEHIPRLDVDSLETTLQRN